MKKKLLTLLMALVAIVACAFDQGDFNYSVNSDGTTTLAPAKAERARNATIKIATPNFMRVFYHNSSPQRLPSARKSSTAK